MRWLLLLALAVSPACAPREPLCSAEIDRSGRGVPVCDTVGEVVVCDDPGATAEYIRDAAGRLVLRGGTLATCDTSNQPVCADRTVLPRCVLQPEF